VDAVVGRGLVSGGALGDADGVEEVISDGATDSDAADDPGARDGALAQAATSTTDRTSDAVDRNNQAASATRGTCESRACYEGPGELPRCPSIVAVMSNH
jgi:hypothetical protein